MIYGGGKNVVLGKNINGKNIKKIKVGNYVTILDNARILLVKSYCGCKYCASISIGNDVMIGYNFTIMAAAPIEIHDHVLIASNVMITSENHGIDPEFSKSYAGTPLNAKPVVIGEGCWLGERLMIMPGVVLGKRCVVGAGSIVTKSFPDYSLIAGVPAKIIKKYNFSTHT